MSFSTPSASSHRPCSTTCHARSVDENAPLACSLSSADAQTRQGEWRSLLASASVNRISVPGGMRVELRDIDGVRDALGRLVQLERECCPFLDIHVRREERMLLLVISGPPQAEEIIASMVRAGA